MAHSIIWQLQEFFTQMRDMPQRNIRHAAQEHSYIKSIWNRFLWNSLN